MLERLKGIRNDLGMIDDYGGMPGSYCLYKFADVVFDLCRDFERRLIEVERKLEAVEICQRGPSER